MPSHCGFALQSHTEPASPGHSGRADGEHSGSRPAEHDRRGRRRQREPLALEAGLGRKNGWYEEAGDKSRLERSEQFLPLRQAPLSSPKGGFRGVWGLRGTLATAVSCPGMRPSPWLRASLPHSRGEGRLQGSHAWTQHPPPRQGVC